MRHFDPVDDEVQVGYDERFERRWRVTELCGRLVMLLVVAAGLVGLLGRGPYSHHTVRSKASGLAVDFEPVSRFGDQTMITLHLRPVSCADGATIRLNNTFIEPMGLLRIMPRPLSSTPLPDGIALRYALDPAHCAGTEIRLFAEPTGIGFVSLKLRLDDRPVLPVRLFVVP